MASAQLYWGAPCCGFVAPTLSCVPHGGLGICLCGWCLLASAEIPGRTTHMCHPLFLVTCGCPLSWKKTALLQAKNSTVLLVHCIGQQTAALSQNHSFKPSGNGNRQSSHQDDQTNFSGGLLTIASSRKTTITSPHMLHRAHGGVLAMQVLQILKLRKKAGLVIYPSLRRTRSGGSITRWLRMFTLKRSRAASPSVASLLWRCSARCAWLCIFARRARPSGDRSYYHWQVNGLLNEYSRKMPTAGLLMEIMFQLTATSCSLMPACEARPQSMGWWLHPSFFRRLWCIAWDESCSALGETQDLSMDSTTSRCSSRSSGDGASRACRSCSCSEEAEEELVPDLVEL